MSDFELPITYSFRESGDSFVKLLPYLRRVAPAVWREVQLRSEPCRSTTSP